MLSRCGHSPPPTALSPWLVSQVATGSDLQGGGVFSFIKAKGTPQNRAIIASVFLAVGVLIANPDVVSALATDSSVNSM